jgi:hypothetical protein
MGEPVPTNMDGRVLQEIFQPNSGLDRPTNFEDPTTGHQDKVSYTNEETEAIEEHLRNLGYI